MKIPKQHKIAIIAMICIAVIAAISWIVGVRLKQSLMPAATRTHTVFSLAKVALSSELRQQNRGLPHTSGKPLGFERFASSVSTYGLLSGGRVEVSFGSGDILLVVGLSREPIINVYYSDSPSEKALAERLVNRLRTVYDKSLVPTAVAGLEKANLGGGTESSTLKVTFIRWAEASPGILVLCGAAILAIFIWNYLRSLWKRSPGTYCASCGYDLRGTPGDRCSECGAVLNEEGAVIVRPE